jgi:hypothetical protein
MLKAIKFFLSLTLCAYLFGCGTDSSSGGGSSDSTAPGATQGVIITTSDGSTVDGSSFSLRLTDAPVDKLRRVVVRFSAIEMKLQSNRWIKYTLPKPQSIDLLALQGLATADLLLHMPIVPGDYKQLRFIVDDTPMANFVELTTGGVENLTIRNGSTVGLKVRQPFTIPANRLVNFTVDFDLRKAVRKNRSTGLYRLRSKMRLVVDSDVGFIRGAVAPARLLDPGCSDLNVDTHNAVYVFSGHDVVPDDINELSTANVEPITTTTIKYDAASGLYIYEAAFLPEDDYTIAFTCNADLEDLEADDNLPFFFTRNVSVMVTDTTFLQP